MIEAVNRDISFKFTYDGAGGPGGAAGFAGSFKVRGKSLHTRNHES